MAVRCHRGARAFACYSSSVRSRGAGIVGIALLLVGCGAPAVVAPQGCAGETSFAGDPAARPLVIVGNRAGDSLDLVDVDPLAKAGCISVDENVSFIDEPFDLALPRERDQLLVVLGHADGYTRGTLLRAQLPAGGRLAQLDLGEEPASMAIASDQRRAWVALFRNLKTPSGPWTATGALVAVDLDAWQVTGTVDVCAAALGVARDDAGERVWVTCLGDDHVAVVDTRAATPTLIGTFTLDDGAGSHGLQPAYVLVAGERVFVTAQGSGDLWIFDRASMAFVKRIDLGSSSFPQRMALMHDGAHVLIAVDGASQLGAVVMPALVLTARIPLPGIHPQALAVTSDDRFALVSDENDLIHPGRLARVSLGGLDAGGATLDGTVPAGTFPQAVLIVP